ncbi:endonuclease domain-containing protein [Micromonospora sp. NPDC048986]|uniref:endonuclease domain-containing protein n=1 Tax=Micromonospora sp. NPDC048986 TaxID=3155644 RepID=UPI00340E125F
MCCLRLPTPRTLARYRLTPDRYRELRVKQEGVCAICGKGTWNRPLVIDHDHVCCLGRNKRRTCGVCVRGLLCPGCNGCLGEFELWGRLPGLNDGGQWEAAARTYLDRAGCDPTAPHRRHVLADHHRANTATWPRPCGCFLCAPVSPGPSARAAARKTAPLPGS